MYSSKLQHHTKWKLIEAGGREKAAAMQLGKGEKLLLCRKGAQATGRMSPSSGEPESFLELSLFVC